MTEDKPSIDINDTVSITNDSICVVMDDERVALNMESNEYYNINDIGSLIWTMIEKQPQTLAALCEQLYTQFSDDDQEVIKTDVINFVVTCQQQGTLAIKKG